MIEKMTSTDGIHLEFIKKINPHSKGKVLLVHGITVDMHEGGMFDRLSNCLFDLGYSTMQFSFRGHGASEGTQEGVTIAGEILDLHAAIRNFQEHEKEDVFIVAASFGAVSTSVLCSIPFINIKHLVLWNPVLDLDNTFLNPTLPWGQENFSTEKRSCLSFQDYLMIDGSFKAGFVLFNEFKYYNPKEYLINSNIQTLIIHGNKDKYVSYEISKTVADTCDNIELITVENSDHGFDSREKEEYAIDCTIQWIQKITK